MMSNIAIAILLFFLSPISAIETPSEQNVKVLEGEALILNCSSSSSNDKCHFENPHGQIDKSCIIFIKYASQDYEGKWQCLRNGTVNLFHVQITDDPNVQVLEIKPGDSLTLNCSNSSSDLPKKCSFKSPQNKGYNFENSTELTDESLNETIGDHCSIPIEHVTKKHEGKWSCFENDQEKLIYVLIKENDIEEFDKTSSRTLGQLQQPEVEQIDVQESANLTMTCSVGTDTNKIMLCFFKSPSGSKFNFKTNMTLDDSRIEGQVADHCSIFIQNVTKEDHGIWRCTERDKQKQFEITVHEKPPEGK